MSYSSTFTIIPMATNARFIVIKTLAATHKTRRPVTQIFNHVISSSPIGQTDRQLAMNIIYGVLRHRQQLEFLLAKLCDRPPTSGDGLVYQAMLTGLFQIFFLDRIPEFAAVNETVSAARQAGLGKQTRGFINGVLRTALRRRGELVQLLAEITNEGRFLNHPDWLTRRWTSNFGMDAMRTVCAQNNREPVLCLRVSRSFGREKLRLLFAEHGISSSYGTIAPDALLLDSFRGTIESLPGYEHGYFQVQDQAAQLATLMLGPFSAGRSYLDCCAGLGGKTTYLVDLLRSDEAVITAIEPEPVRFQKLEDNLSRSGGGRSVTCHQVVLEHFAATARNRFDAVLVDAPCSGTGVIGRHPDIRWNRRDHDLAAYQRQQFALLKTAAGVLAPGGILVYATCSIEPEENSSVINLFLEENRNFQLTDCRDTLPPSAHHLLISSCFSPLPAYGQDGFFAARMQLVDGS